MQKQSLQLAFCQGLVVQPIVLPRRHVQGVGNTDMVCLSTPAVLPHAFGHARAVARPGMFPGLVPRSLLMV